MEAGSYDSACPSIAESHRLDPRPGTLFTLADCRAKSGKLATALALYEDYLRAVFQMTMAQKLRHAERAKVAAAQKKVLAAQIPELTLVLPPSAPKEVRVLRDGTELTEASLGIALPVDPGEHVVTTQVGDGPAVEQRITLEKGEKRTVELEVKEPPPAAPAPAPEVVVVPKGPAAAVAEPEGAAGQGMSGRRIGAFIAGGIGVAGLALGGVMGGMALSKKSTIDASCVDGICNAEGKAAADGARTPGLLSTIGFGVGAAGVAAGLVLFLTEPSSSQTGSAKGKVTASVLGVGSEGAAVGVKGVF